MLSASDGEIGHVKDFYFVNNHWAVRQPSRVRKRNTSQLTLVVSCHQSKLLFFKGMLRIEDCFSPLAALLGPVFEL